MKHLSPAPPRLQRWRSLLCGAALALGAAAQAAIVVLPGSGELYDTGTGLVWARLGMTNISWAEAAAAPAPYRLATAGEAITFFQNAGVEIGTFQGPDLDPDLTSLISLWGDTVCCLGGVTGSEAWLADGSPGSHAVAQLAAYYDPSVNLYTAIARIGGGPDEGSPFISAAWVRVVPEPATWGLMLLGAVALAARCRRRPAA